MSKLYLVSLGCNKNLVDSEIMLGRLKNYELTQNPSEADVMIVNTCGFINSAKQESINTILELATYKKKNSVLVVTGCLMQRYKEELMKELPEVDVFSGVGDYDKIDEIILKKQNIFTPLTYLQKNEQRVISGSNFHAYIKISEGCNQKCSFCAIPTFKGKLKSRNLDDIVDEVDKLCQNGYYDFSFIAQDSSSYNKDNGINDGLIELIDRVEKIKGVRFARILYLYPTTTSNALIKRIISSNVFLNYFDMPIQHISDNMLKIMKRGANKKRIKELLNLMRSAKNSFLRTGIIVGHPGEGEDDFIELCEFLQEFKFDRITAFAYSKEEDTACFSMEQIPNNVIVKRLNKIEKIINDVIFTNFQNDVGKEILCEINGISSEGEMFYGAKNVLWDKDIDGEILINDSVFKTLQVGKVYKCKITNALKDKLIGEILDFA